MPSNSGKNTTIEDDGTIVLSDDALVYDDLLGAVASAKLPASSAPAWTTYDFNIVGGVAFAVLGFDTNEYMDVYLQTTHAAKLNTIIENHVHWTIPTDSSGDKIKFQLDVIAAGIGETFAVPAGSPFTAESTLDGTESGKHNYLNLAHIPAFNTTVSSICIIRFKRIAATSNDYSGNVYVLFNDSHTQNDTMGSRAEAAK